MLIFAANSKTWAKIAKVKGNPDSADAQRDADFFYQIIDLGKNRKGKSTADSEW
jgi:hypothetical protein